MRRQIAQQSQGSCNRIRPEGHETWKKGIKGTTKRVRIDNSILRQANAYSFKQKVKEIITNLQNEEEMNTPDLHKKFELLIVQSAKEIVEVGVKKHPDWYTQSPLIMSRHIHLHKSSL